MKYLFWFYKVSYAKKLLEIVKRMQLISSRLKWSDRYAELEQRRFLLTEDLLNNWDENFHEFDLREMKKLDTDSANFSALLRDG